MDSRSVWRLQGSYKVGRGLVQSSERQGRPFMAQGNQPPVFYYTVDVDHRA